VMGIEVHENDDKLLTLGRLFHFRFNTYLFLAVAILNPSLLFASGNRPTSVYFFLLHSFPRCCVVMHGATFLSQEIDTRNRHSTNCDHRKTRYVKLVTWEHKHAA